MVLGVNIWMRSLFMSEMDRMSIKINLAILPILVAAIRTDTSGVHRAKGVLNIRILDVALSGLADVDLILIVLDVTNPDHESEKILVKRLGKQKRSVIFALNNIDLIKNLYSLL